MLADIHQHQRYSPEGKQIVHDEVPKDVRPFRTRHSMSLNHAPKFTYKFYTIKETEITLRFPSQT